MSATLWTEGTGIRMLLPLLPFLVVGCGGAVTRFGDDLGYLKGRTDVIVLSDGDMRVAVAPALHGRVMTASYDGDAGPSLGWVNRAAIENGETDAVFNNFGGGDRFWLGPEAGQFGLYFAPGDPQNDEHWHVPPALNTGGFQVDTIEDDFVRLSRSLELGNVSGTKFRLHVERMVSLLSRSGTQQFLGATIPDNCDQVGYSTRNTIRNEADKPLDPAKGTVSVWILGQFPGTNQTVVIAPYNRDGDGPVFHGDYFEPIPPQRVMVLKDEGVVLFRADGRQRGKIGLPRERATDVLASIDFGRNILTVVRFSFSPSKGEYVDSHWINPQPNPYAGDVINSYNNNGAADDPPTRFYELEASSVAAKLDPDTTLSHRHTTIHVHGPLTALSRISREVLGVSLERVRQAMLDEETPAE